MKRVIASRRLSTGVGEYTEHGVHYTLGIQLRTTLVGWVAVPVTLDVLREVEHAVR